MFGGNQVCGQRNATFVDGAEESGGEERAVKLERVCYFGRGLVSNAVGDQAARREVGFFEEVRYGGGVIWPSGARPHPAVGTATAASMALRLTSDI